jgi:uncharacterized protein YjaZ
MFNVHCGLDTFYNKINNHPNEEKVQRWLMYYNEYKEAFDVLFQKLYMIEIHQLEPMINNIDFEELLTNAEKGMNKYPLSYIEKIVKKCVHYFDFKADFNLFLLVGLGHIDGAAPPSRKPFLYLGLERLVNTDINVLIPHEFNHLVRFHSLRHIEQIDTLTVKQLIIAEGLATITPLIMNAVELNDDQYAKALMLSKDDYAQLQSEFCQIEQEIQQDLHHTLTPALVEKYFMANVESTLPRKSGYYYGLHIIKTLIKNGASLEYLTYEKTNTIFSLYEASSP